MNVLIMAGGTGGHVMPALAVAKELRSRGHAVRWLGTDTGLEARAVPAAGIELFTLPVAGLRGKCVLRYLSAPVGLLRALWQAISLLRRLRPDVVLGLGGYAAGPGGLAAFALRRPLVIHEQNARPGLTNRLLAWLARRGLCGFAGTHLAGRGPDCR
jgi:UDP-N-acetylglucosamine--N-acetylmuramyl-(pentapeptide) pyrophosphoryl-undecaprenol N-acetylglucosamine transferase